MRKRWLSQFFSSSFASDARICGVTSWLSKVRECSDVLVPCCVGEEEKGEIVKSHRDDKWSRAACPDLETNGSTVKARDWVMVCKPFFFFFFFLPSFRITVPVIFSSWQRASLAGSIVRVHVLCPLLPIVRVIALLSDATQPHSQVCSLAEWALFCTIISSFGWSTSIRFGKEPGFVSLWCNSPCTVCVMSSFPTPPKTGPAQPAAGGQTCGSSPL